MLRDLRVLPGDPTPLAGFFEFETEIGEETFASGGPPPFVANGVLAPSGILCAYGPGAYRADDAAVVKARRLSHRSAAARTLIHVRDGVVDAIEMGGEDVTKEFGEFAGPYGLRITEFAMGFYRAPEGSLDWRVNSPVNEGVQGVHLGIGDGYSSLHFDFVCDDVASDSAGS
jgi:hypothetical protein